MRIVAVSILLLMLIIFVDINNVNANVVRNDDTVLSSHNVDIGSVKVDFSTYYGGNGNDWLMDLSFDQDGNQIAAGGSWSTDLPMLNAYQDSNAGGEDGYLVKFSSDYDLRFATYFGGSDDDEIRSLVIDEHGNIIIAGTTASNDFPTLNALHNDTLGGTDGFVAKFNPEGELIFSTYIGGNQYDLINDLTIDPSGNYHCTGWTNSEDIEITQGAYQDTNGGGLYDMFLLALSQDGQSIEYSTYFGDSHQEGGFKATFDEHGNIVLIGICYSGSITTEGAYQQEYGGGQSDGIIIKMGPNAETLLWSTLLGGDGWEFPYNIEFDSEGQYIIAGYTGSTDFPLVNQLFNDTGNYDAFLTRMSSDGTEILNSTYFGGDSEDRCYGMCLLSDDSVVLTSPASSQDMPIVNAFQNESNGRSEGYMAILGHENWSIEFASYFGGSRNDYCFDADVFNDTYIAVIGYTNSNDFPTHNPFQENYSLSDDSFLCVFKIEEPIDGEPEQPDYTLYIVATTSILIILVIIVFIFRKKKQ